MRQSVLKVVGDTWGCPLASTRMGGGHTPPSLPPPPPPATRGMGITEALQGVWFPRQGRRVWALKYLPALVLIRGSWWYHPKGVPKELYSHHIHCSWSPPPRKEQACNPGTTLSRGWVWTTGLELDSLMPGPDWWPGHRCRAEYLKICDTPRLHFSTLSEVPE